MIFLFHNITTLLRGEIVAFNHIVFQKVTSKGQGQCIIIQRNQTTHC
jgi:hypothetical protein